MTNAFEVLSRMLGSFLRLLLYFFTLGFLTEIIAWIRRICERCRRGKGIREVRRGRPLGCEPKCARVSPEVYKRADPLIYSQTYLMEQGLAVTWNNPDIQIFDGNVPVTSSDLEAGKTYNVVSTVYNNSTDAPAVGLPVKLSFRSFGVGAAITHIGDIKIDLPVKGSPDHPAKAAIQWTTPTTPGHYCLLVELIWPDDANPKNNIGQENTNVGIAASPANFNFVVRNDDTIPKHIRMVADSYQIPGKINCDKRPRPKDSIKRHPDLHRQDVYVPPLEAGADWAFARFRHAVSNYPIPSDWDIEIIPEAFDLNAGATKDVQVIITPPDSFTGEKPFNINAMYGSMLLGGVTLTVKR